MVEEFASTRALAWRRVRRRPLGALPRHTLGVLVMLRPRPALPIAWRSLTSARLSPPARERLPGKNWRPSSDRNSGRTGSPLEAAEGEETRNSVARRNHTPGISRQWPIATTRKGDGHGGRTERQGGGRHRGVAGDRGGAGPGASRPRLP